LQLHLITIPNIAKNFLSLLYRAGEILFSLAWAEMEYIGSDKTELANECMKKLGRSLNSRTNGKNCVFLLKNEFRCGNFFTMESFKESDREVPIRSLKFYSCE
jgi:hypothetical protein